MEKKLIPILILAAILTILLFNILTNSIKNGKFTCKKYILNTYLYVCLTIIFIALFLSLLKYYNINLYKKLNLNKFGLIALFILLIISVIGLSVMSPDRIILKHLLWLFVIILIAISFHPIHFLYDKLGLNHLINSAFITTLVLVLALTAFAFFKPELIKLSWGPVLFFMLLGVIVLELLVLLFKGSKPTLMHKIISYLVICIFIGYLLYDTKMLQIRAKNCVEGTADYIKESFNIFLDIWNLFIRILSVQSKN